ncbi:MAG: peroxiredoxin family protein [Woeseiaceae bacterium]|nr:peroxiredoxin family protein [Woeseiaceae bacterium]
MSTIGIVIVVVAAIAGLLYALWRKQGGRPVPEHLKPGQPLPEFEAVDENGARQSSRSLAGSPAILLFVRGSWCPFCSRQVADLTRAYKKITDAGAKLILVTPKPLVTTRRVADMFGVEFDFWLDESLAIARQLGIFLEGAVPNDQRNDFGEDTLWPAALVVDADGIIRHSEVSKILVDRPDPSKLLSVVRSL